MVKTKKKILVADPDASIVKNLRMQKDPSLYIFEVAKDGFECLSKIESWEPDLVLVELMLPRIHGMEVLRKIKIDPRTRHIGVILMTAHAMIQNYQAALKLDCDYFLEKPFEFSEVFPLLKRFFESKLQPGPFSGKESFAKSGHCYVPKMHSTNSYIKFWGTRGSNPVSGPDYVRFGGNTSCLEIRHGHDLIIIDAGTGIRPLGTVLAESKPKHIHLMISHTHWDHLAGFPFFAPIYDSDCQITIWTPIGFEMTTKELFTEMLTYSYFPVRLDDIQANIVFKDLLEGEPFSIGSIHVNTHYAYHPGATVCFKFTVDKTTFGYATDNEFLMGYHGNPALPGKNHRLLTPYLSMIRFFKDCDFLVHEAQYNPLEYQKKVGWGHSSITNATVLITRAQIREWIIPHHDPRHTDADLLKKMQMQYELLDTLKNPCRPRMAFDGMIVPL